MKRCLAVSLPAVVAMVLASASAHAAVLFDNGPSGEWYGLAHDLSGSIQAEDFTLTHPAIVTAIRFYAIEKGSAYAGSILWSIREHQSGVPAPTVLASELSQTTRIPTGVFNNDHYGAAESLVTIDITPVALDAGHYWLTLHNGPLSNDEPSTNPRIFRWQSTAETPFPGSIGVEDVAPFEGTWEIVYLGERSFQLIGVPEPAFLTSLMLISFALGCHRARCQV